MQPDDLSMEKVLCFYKEYASKLDPMLFKKRIGNFWKHDFNEMSEGQIFNAINEVLSVDDSIIFPVNYKIITPEMQLYRIRHVPLSFVPSEKDCWSPPEGMVMGNRLNRRGDPWLYTSFNAGTAFSEMPIPLGKNAMVIIYKPIEELKLSFPGFNMDTLQTDFSFSRKEILRLELVTQFMRDLFMIEVNEGEGYLYKITQVFPRRTWTIPKVLEFAILGLRHAEIILL